MRPKKSWTFITNHGAVLGLIGKKAMMTTREISLRLGITERTVHNILSDLVEAGYITKSKVGRRNHFVVHPDLPLRRIEQRQVEVGSLLNVLNRVLAAPK
jgi:DNA-binding Lrp family transcriptional regulator